MKSLTLCTFASAGILLAFSSLFGQQVIRAISLGDPIPAYEPDPNLIRVNSSSPDAGAVTLGFQVCDEPAKGYGSQESVVCFTCPATCGAAAPACAVAAKAAPCRACDIVKTFHRAPAAPTAASFGYAPCSDKIGAPSIVHGAASTTHVRKLEHPRPILAAMKSFVSGFAPAPAKAEVCTTCATGPTATVAVVPPIHPIPTQAPSTLPRTVSYESPMQGAAPVPAALAPYTPQTPYFPSLPPAEDFAAQR